MAIWDTTAGQGFKQKSVTLLRSLRLSALLVLILQGRRFKAQDDKGKQEGGEARKTQARRLFRFFSLHLCVICISPSQSHRHISPMNRCMWSRICLLQRQLSTNHFSRSRGNLFLGRAETKKIRGEMRFHVSTSPHLHHQFSP